MQAIEESLLKRTVIGVLDELPPDRVAEVLEFALFLRERLQAESEEFRPPVPRAVPAADLEPLVGLVAWGGDAVADAEHLYE